MKKTNEVHDYWRKQRDELAISNKEFLNKRAPHPSWKVLSRYAITLTFKNGYRTLLDIWDEGLTRIIPELEKQWDGKGNKSLSPKSILMLKQK